MPGANCSIFGCTKSRTTKGLAIFGIPEKDDEWLTTKQQNFLILKQVLWKENQKDLCWKAFICV